MDIASAAAHTARMARPAPLLVAVELHELAVLDFPDTPAHMKNMDIHSQAGSNHFVAAGTAGTAADMVGMVADTADTADMAADMLGSGSTMYVIRPE